MEERTSWIELFDVYYHLGVDGFSVPLILLTTFTTILVVAAGWEVISDRQHQYMAAFLVQTGLMIGAFSALDSVLFYVFWEAMLIPMFLIIGIWVARGGSTQQSSFSFTHSLVPYSCWWRSSTCIPKREALRFSTSTTATDDAEQTLIFVAFVGVRGEGADVAGAYVVARRARGSANGWFGRAGCRDAETGWLWLHPFLHAHRA